MTKRMLFITGVVAVATATMVACTNETTKEGASTVISKDSLIKRGDYLVTTMGCDDCHSSKKMGPNGIEVDMDHRLAGFVPDSTLAKGDISVLKGGWMLFSGTSMIGPWGQTYAANITSDATGIGNWTEEQFFTALKKGKAKGIADGRTLLPPMPWQNYANMHDEDVRAIFAYLKSIKPVNNLVPSPVSITEFK